MSSIRTIFVWIGDFFILQERGGNKVTEFEPYYIEELEGDTLTPILIFKRMTGRKKFLFESSLKHEKSGRYSFIGADPILELVGEGDKCIVISPEGKKLIREKPLNVLKTLLPKQSLNRLEQFPFCGGAIGFVGYDAIRQYVDIGKVLYDELEIPDVHFMFFEDAVVFDHLEQKVKLVSTSFFNKTDREKVKERLEKRKLEITLGTTESITHDAVIRTFKASVKKEVFMERVQKAKEYIEKNEVSQVVLSQRLQADFTGDPFSFYRKLRVKNPSPYMYYINFGDYQIVGSSPESLIKMNGDKVSTNPIAGTRPRGKTEEEDNDLMTELLNDAKEISEHLMLLELGKKDLSYICKENSVSVDKEMKVELYKHVMHLVSEVSGELKDDLTAIEALLACLPAGTVSGSPKKRAMEIINEFEDVKRGVYSGAIGYFSANGNMDFAIAIRTMLIKEEKAYIQAGAGIVQASIPEKEYEETLHKLKAFLIEEENK